MKHLITRSQKAPQVVTWASFPGPTLAPIGHYYMSDIGPNGSLWYNNGTRILPVSGEVLLASQAIPIVIPSSGSIGNNGALSGITALVYAYPNCYMRFPANAISAGSPAGFYYVEMLSTTTGTIYNNVHDGLSLPIIPAAPTPFVTTGPGAYTQSVLEFTVFSCTIPGGILGKNGYLDVFCDKTHTNSVNNKVLRALLGGVEVQNIVHTTTAGQSTRNITQNRGRLDQQRISVSNGASEATVNTGNTLFKNIDTSVNCTYQIKLQLVSASDNVCVERVFVKAGIT